MKIFFEAHGTTFDNEANLASGWNDVALSELGKQNAKDLGERYKDTKIDAVFCADLERTYQTAVIAFPDFGTQKIFVDWRLRECDYGDMTKQDKDKVDAEKINRIDTPFPNGESYRQTIVRLGSFIEDLKTMKHQTVVVVGSRATHYGLDYWIDGVSIEECVQTKFKWQPGWEYELK